MKKLLLLLLLAAPVQAADNRIVILNSATVTVQSGDRTYIGEVKVMCIAGLKWVLIRVGHGDSNVVLQQVYETGGPVRCDR
jgi:hypothetical protein